MKKKLLLLSLLQNKNDLSNMGTNFFLQQCELQSFDKNISEEIPMDNCFSESKHSTQENPESNISSNNDLDF